MIAAAAAVVAADQAIVATVLHRSGRLPGNVLTAHNPGGTLKITIGEENDEVTSILLEGPTEIVKVYEL